LNPDEGPVTLKSPAPFIEVFCDALIGANSLFLAKKSLLVHVVTIRLRLRRPMKLLIFLLNSEKPIAATFRPNDENPCYFPC